MKRFLGIIVILVLLLALLPVSTYAADTDVYVSAAGSDDNSGTAQSPYGTMEKAFEMVPDGGTIHVIGTVSFPEGYTWTSHGKSMVITGDTLNFKELGPANEGEATNIAIGDPTHFRDITLSFDGADNLFAAGNKVIIDEDVTMEGTINIFGGNRSASVASTDLTILAGNYWSIHGGGRWEGGYVEGDVNLTVGGNTNAAADPTSHNEEHMIYGGGDYGEVRGTVNLTVTGNVKANYVYGGGKNEKGTVRGGTNTVISGNVQIMSVYGCGKNNTQGSDARVVILDGSFEQIFGGADRATHEGNVSLQILGGQISRRVYGGCYNDYDGSWGGDYYVNGKISMTIGGGASITFTSSSSDRSVYARSRHATKSATEISELIFADVAESNRKVGAQDGTMQWIMGSLSAADTIHYFTYTASGNTITGTCSHCSMTSQAVVSIDSNASLQYTGMPITPAKVTTTNWCGAEPVIVYENNIQTGTATASMMAGTAVASTDFEITAYYLSLTLNKSIAINFKVTKEYIDTKGFEKVEFYIDGELMRTVTSLPDENNGLVNFSYDRLTPAQMGEDVTARFYYADGTQEDKTTSVLRCSMSILQMQDADSNLKKAVVDMLNYGAACQQYVGMAEGETLVNVGLGDYAALGTTATPELTTHTVLGEKAGTETVTWRSASLNLKDSITVRLKFNTESTDGLVLKITCGSKTWEVTQFTAINGDYYAYFSGLNPAQLRERFYAEFYKDGVKVSQKLTYSVESYAYAVSKNNAESAEMKALSTAMMRYSDSVYAWVVCSGHGVIDSDDITFSLTNGGTQTYTFEDVKADTNYYVEVTLGAPTAEGYVGFAHLGSDSTYFYDTFSYDATEDYYHSFSSVIGGAGRVYSEPAKYYCGNTTGFGASGMKIATLRAGNQIHTFVNGKRIATYLVEDELAALSTVPALYFYNSNGSYYDGQITDMVVVTGQSATQAKLAALTTGGFSYANTPNWNSGTNTDAIFNDDGGFTYAYDSSVSAGDRRYVTGVNDRVFLAGDYYYQYEISGDMAYVNSSGVYGLLFNWINTKCAAELGNYKHEVNFVLKLNGSNLQRLTFDKGSGANGDGSSDWVSNTTTYGGRNDLESDTTWQEAFKGGLIVRIERTVSGDNTDTYVISVTAKSDPTLKLTSTEITVTDDTFGGYNWILFGTQSVNCTISNVTYGKIEHDHVHDWAYAYTWSETQCLASRTCDTCGVTEAEKTQGELVSINPATKDAAGKKIYTCTFENSHFNDNFTVHAVEIPANTPFSITEGGKQTYVFDGISSSKNYYIEATLSASEVYGYVGLAHWADESNHFYDVVSYDAAENYYHSFSGVVNGSGRVYKEPAKYYNDTTAFGTEGMTFATLRMGDVVHTFVNGKRIGTYLIETELAKLDTIPVLYFEDANGSFYDGSIHEIVIVSDEAEVQAKLAELTVGSKFSYVNTPNWDTSKGTHTDATFNEDGFTYTYDSSVSAGDRRFVTGVNDRVFLAGNYYYQYEIVVDKGYVNVNNMYGLFYNWINTKALTDWGYYKHEVNFVLKLNTGDKLQRLTFDKGSGVNGDGSSDWVSNTTAYGGRNDLESDAVWQEAFKDGLIVRIERTVKDSTTDSYVISVTAKSNPELKITSTPIEVTDDTFGGYNWILFGTQSVDCTISNVSYGHIHNWNYTYQWNDTQCTATRQCVCGESETETVTGVLSEINPATKTAAGKKTYTATFQTAVFNENFEIHIVEIPANTSFSITEGGKQHYAFDGISASKNYYIEVQLGASTASGYVGIAHWADESNHFYDAVSYDASEKYYHAFSGVVDGSGRVYKEPAKYYGDTTSFGTEGMTFAVLREGDTVYTFVNGKRIATYLMEEELGQQDTVPVLYFENVGESFYAGQISDVVIVTDAAEVTSKLEELTAGSNFSYADTPNWDKTNTDAAFNADGFTYAYDSSVSTGDRRYVTGVNDRVFLAGNYYYQYEISGDIVASSGSNVYGLLYNWVNTKSTTALGNYKHEVNFVLKMNGSNLQRLTFDKGSGANGDGSSGWVSNTTTYGGRNDLESDTTWQEAFKGGLIVRIERTVKSSTTDVYVITVTAKNNPELKLTSTSIEVTDDTFGGYNWILFGTQSVDCTISNVTYGRK